MQCIIRKPDCSHPAFYRECLEAFNDCLLEQKVTLPTRGQNILVLFLSSNPILIDKTTILPGLSDHDIVLAEVNVKAKINKQVPRDILLYKKADWDRLKQYMRDFHKLFCPNSLPQTFRFCGTSSSHNSRKTSTHLS